MGLPQHSAGEFDRIVFNYGSVRIGAFRCHPNHARFHDSGPATNCCFVFPRTAVKIQHENAPAFVANPNVVTFYNSGQAYRRNAISPEGDRCDWFGVDADIVLEAVQALDPKVNSRPEHPFRFTRSSCDPSTYLLQRRVYTRISSEKVQDPLAVEECVLHLLERILSFAYTDHLNTESLGNRPQRCNIIHDLEEILSQCWEEPLTIREIAGKVGLTPYHVCRLFRAATGTTLHQYRQRLRLRGSLESVIESRRPLIDIALDSGFASHSHFTNAFHREFAETPSAVRGGSAAARH